MTPLAPPDWLWAVPYDASALPSAEPLLPGEGANCQRFAYAVLTEAGRSVPPHRSSELWSDETLTHPPLSATQPLDLVLFNDADEAYGAHLAVVVADDQLLHLCREVGQPTVWRWSDFVTRPRYAHVVGAVRPTAS